MKFFKSLSALESMHNVFVGWLNVKNVHVVFELDVKELYTAYCFVYYPFKTVTSKSSK